jgi:hypothetical protein
MSCMRILLSLLAMQACVTHAAEPDSGCGNPAPLQVRIRMADGPPQPALLSGGATPGLRLTVAGSAEELWSAGPQTGATQVFGQMTAPFGHSLNAIDLDGDGTHDRIYAGDRLGRLWRFDLDGSASAPRWASGGVIADLGRPGVARGFIAAPDVALINGSSGTWLNIALGTATVGEGLAENRFYVIRDHAAFETWSAERYRSLVPLSETDLQQVRSPLQAEDEAGPGYFIPLGTSQVLAQSLTLSGFVHFTVAETSRFLTGCADDTSALPTSVLSITVIRAIDGEFAQDLNADGRVDYGDQRVTLPGSLPADAGFELVSAPGEGVPRQFCTVAGVRIEACSLDTAPHRTYWRREDAD